ncbi:MAG: 50S ribosomal protein L13 [Candidatus Omnitrophica bacterium]|jgi:large subunit ribosomal protein L13|nr:50S ribosomal protein L13 [Candidatus Omnitrophota bacterium]
MRQKKTFLPKVESIEKKYFLIDAKDKVLGRLATNVATILMGKHKPLWTPFLDTGDFVIIINAEKVKFTGKKLLEKAYYRHSGYLGGLKKETAFSLLQKNPETVIFHAVKGMLPKNHLGRKMLKKLKVYKGPEHLHQAQKPALLEF